MQEAALLGEFYSGVQKKNQIHAKAVCLYLTKEKWSLCYKEFKAFREIYAPKQCRISHKSNLVFILQSGHLNYCCPGYFSSLQPVLLLEYPAVTHVHMSSVFRKRDGGKLFWKPASKTRYSSLCLRSHTE